MEGNCLKERDGRAFLAVVWKEKKKKKKVLGVRENGEWVLLSCFTFLVFTLDM